MELHRPAEPSGAAMLLTHGAGGNCRAPLLVAVADAFAAAGILVGRYDLPFRQRRASGPPMPAGAAADRAGLREALKTLQQMVSGPVYLAGHSYGGRQASILASEEPGLAAALLLLSYPLHPPGKPDRLRTDHFPKLRTPALFVYGSKDDFGSETEMAAAISLIPAPTARLTLAGLGHDLKQGKFDLAAMVTEFKRLAQA